MGSTIVGCKRHLLTTRSACRALVVHAADIQDRDRLARVCHRIRCRFPWLELVFADGGHQGDRVDSAATRERLRLAIAKRPRDAQGFHFLPRRRVIERTFAWLSRNRRLAKDVETLIEASTAIAAVAIIQLLVRRLATI